eukprot:10075730-Prorocentrum_lima.AAC.1
MFGGVRLQKASITPSKQNVTSFKKAKTRPQRRAVAQPILASTSSVESDAGSGPSSSTRGEVSTCPLVAQELPGSASAPPRPPNPYLLNKLHKSPCGSRWC